MFWLQHAGFQFPRPGFKPVPPVVEVWILSSLGELQGRPPFSFFLSFF